MTFKCTTIDATTGKPVPGILITANLGASGHSYDRSSDGNGYSDVAILNDPVGAEVLLSVVKEGYAVWTQYFTVTAEDQVVSIPLVPFV